MQSEARYTGVAQLLHWHMAAVIFTAWGIGYYANSLPRGPAKSDMVGLHKAIASTVLVLIVLRIMWRLTHPAPLLPETLAGWQRRAAGLTHGVIYFLMVALPL